MKDRKIDHLIVHHSLSHWGDGEEIMAWHTEPKPRGNGWSAPGYHALLLNGFPTYRAWSRRKPVPEADGRVDRLWPEVKPANGCRFANKDALHVCLIGDLDKDGPTAAQRQKLVDLLAFWCGKYGLDPKKAIYGHGEMQKKIGREKHVKTCPGKLLNMDEVRRLAAERLGVHMQKSEVA